MGSLPHRRQTPHKVRESPGYAAKQPRLQRGCHFPRVPAASASVQYGIIRGSNTGTGHGDPREWQLEGADQPRRLPGERHCPAELAPHRTVEHA
jgi:hypothetical protein